MTATKQRQSGTSDVPALLPYPTIDELDLTNPVGSPLYRIFSYIIPAYKQQGIALVIKRHPTLDTVSVTMGDWAGNKWDLTVSTPETVLAKKFFDKYGMKLLQFVRLIHLTQGEFYISVTNGEFLLTDIQLSLNKWAGPGMVETFAPIIPTPQHTKIEILDDTVFEAIQYGKGSYAGDLIIKPSRFRWIEADSKCKPLYAKVTRRCLNT